MEFCLILQILHLPRASHCPPGAPQKCIKNAIKFKTSKNSETIAGMGAKGWPRNAEHCKKSTNKKYMTFFVVFQMLWTAKLHAFWLPGWGPNAQSTR